MRDGNSTRFRSEAIYIVEYKRVYTGNPRFAVLAEAFVRNQGEGDGRRGALRRVWERNPPDKRVDSEWEADY